MARTAARGDIYHIDVDLIKGREQQGWRFVYVLSPAEHNNRGLVIALPISQGQTLARGTGYTWPLLPSSRHKRGNDFRRGQAQVAGGPDCRLGPNHRIRA